MQDFSPTCIQLRSLGRNLKTTRTETETTTRRFHNFFVNFMSKNLPPTSIQPPARRTSGNRIHPAPVAPPPVSSPSITSILNTGATAFDSQGTDSENLEAVQGPGDNLTEPVKPLPRRAANRRQVAAAAPSSINSTEPVIPIAAEQPQKRTTRGKKGTTKRR